MRKPAVKLTETQWADAVRIYEAHTSLAAEDIGLMFGIHCTTVMRKFKRIGVPMRGTFEYWPGKRLARLRKLRSEKASYGKIAKLLKLSRSAVAGQCFRSGI